MSIVRQSKFRHVFGTALKDEFCYKDLRIHTSAWDSNYIEANSRFFAIGWKAGGGGSLAVLRHNQTGKISADIPLLSGHTAQILDFRFHPFNDYIIATGSEDATIKIWGIPEQGLTQTISKPLVSLEGHSRKVCGVEFHPTASNVLATTAFDFKVKLWDIETGRDTFNVEGFKDAVQSMSWNINGSTFCCTSKDRKFRLVDPRGQAIVGETAGHQGTKGSRCVWMKNRDQIFTVGFGKMSERQYCLWDPRNFAAPLTTFEIDVSAGLIMPFYDEDTNMMFLAGKGDGNIRYYEMTDKDPYTYYLSSYTSSTPQNGMAMLPKLAVDTSSCEVVRMYKMEANAVTPIMFTVPRKETAFQEDLYPDTFAPEASLTAEQWFSGENANPKMISMRNASEYSSTTKPSEFKPKVEEKKPVVNQTSSSNQNLAQENEALKAQVSALQKENEELRAKLAELGVN